MMSEGLAPSSERKQTSGYLRSYVRSPSTVRGLVSVLAFKEEQEILRSWSSKSRSFLCQISRKCGQFLDLFFLREIRSRD
jgi:hypothetical protein